MRMRMKGVSGRLEEEAVEEGKGVKSVQPRLLPLLQNKHEGCLASFARVTPSSSSGSAAAQTAQRWVKQHDRQTAARSSTTRQTEERWRPVG